VIGAHGPRRGGAHGPVPVPIGFGDRCPWPEARRCPWPGNRCPLGSVIGAHGPRRGEAGLVRGVQYCEGRRVWRRHRPSLPPLPSRYCIRFGYAIQTCHRCEFVSHMHCPSGRSTGRMQVGYGFHRWVAWGRKSLGTNRDPTSIMLSVPNGNVTGLNGSLMACLCVAELVMRRLHTRKHARRVPLEGSPCCAAA